ncbi:hypothetical protein GUITHDRAFT_149425 [Guillardia theta CCMP2712]|uniref:Tyrosine-protein kinase ephrin type A/B receptor-like domain-containing protein n=1 Tax=Guillardia theta (strain CCMP2712) TaxID=905079 RepID=L1I5W1_GUITC|nr:hypothetical protein GUITHDRAFT_149425 [Guillardia theta CCMP2712]EKX31240.1 hypothetical protein GUITHDRAFT_149425 [Guillardia theta CCMP2712]|eukprot:XP_005818220.1 hypothetical protein GUITHDRAFT_149425 [Guillardia theta CCMP2712]
MCPVDSYCFGGVLKACPTNSFAGQFSWSIYDCTCEAGYYWVEGNGTAGEGSRCGGCPVGSYCNNSVMQSCPSNSLSVELSSSISACVCINGYYPANGDYTCTLCPANSYCKDGMIMGCPANNFSLAGSSLPTDCASLNACQKNTFSYTGEKINLLYSCGDDERSLCSSTCRIGSAMTPGFERKGIWTGPGSSSTDVRGSCEHALEEPTTTGLVTQEVSIGCYDCRTPPFIIIDLGVSREISKVNIWSIDNGAYWNLAGAGERVLIGDNPSAPPDSCPQSWGCVGCCNNNNGLCASGIRWSGPNQKNEISCNMKGRYITLTTDCLPCSGGNQHGQWKGVLQSAKVELPFCYDCPANSVSIPQSTRCTCLPGYIDALTGLGYTDNTKSACIPDTACSDMPNGVWDLSSNQCILCPSGYYKSGPLECVPCPAGYALNYSGAISQSECTSCTPSYFSDEAGSLICKECPVDMYSNMSGTSCALCPDGSYLKNPLQGSDQCAACVPGYFCVNGVMKLCANHTYSNASSTACEYCPEGSYLKNPLQGSEQCSICEAGNYCSLSQKSACFKNSNSTAGSSLKEQCRCNYGYYQSEPGVCSVCPRNSHCPETCFG